MVKEETRLDTLRRLSEEMLDKAGKGLISIKAATAAVCQMATGQFYSPSRTWTWFKGGIITTTFISDGTRLTSWPERLENQGIRFESEGFEILANWKGALPQGGAQHFVVIVPAESMAEAAAKVAKFGGRAPTLEVGFRLREMFTGEDISGMGFHTIIVAHEPTGEQRGPYNLRLIRYDSDFIERLEGHYAKDHQVKGTGWAFVVDDWSLFQEVIRGF